MRQHRIRIRVRRLRIGFNRLGLFITLYCGLRAFSVSFEQYRLWRPVT